MTKIWVGYSQSLGFRDLITTYIDPFFGPVEDFDVEARGRLELEFGAVKSDPGSFEAYEKTAENEGQFGLDYVLTRFPFEDVPAGLRSSTGVKQRPCSS